MKNNNFKILIDSKNFMSNIEYLENFTQKKMLPVLKANAYGHGIEIISKVLYSKNYKEYVLARFSEAEELYEKLGKNDIKIIILESVSDLKKIKENSSYIISINSYAELRESLDYGIPSEQMKIKLDLGFARNGIMINDLNKTINFIKEKNLKFYGVFTHLFSAEYEDGLEVIEKFDDFVRKTGIERFKQIDLQNSMGVFKYNCSLATHIRTGIVNYGLREDGYFDENLKKVFKLVGKIAEIKETFSEQKYVAYLPLENENKKAKRIAKIKIGYGDGFLKLNEGSKCIINKKEFIIDQISMDNSFITVDNSVQAGDEIILYYDIEKSSRALGIKSTELIILIDKRIKRELKL
ncbi:MAG: alanine racemase [Fusobacteriaceae bacterium]